MQHKVPQMEAKIFQMISKLAWNEKRPGDTGSRGWASQCSIKYGHRLLNTRCGATPWAFALGPRSQPALRSSGTERHLPRGLRKVIRFTHATRTNVWANISEHHHTVGKSPSHCCAAALWNQQKTNPLHFYFHSQLLCCFFHFQQKTGIKTNRNYITL